MKNMKAVDLVLGREKYNPKEIIQQEEQKENNTVKKLILTWYSGYAEKFRKKPQQIKQQIDTDIIPMLGKISLDKIQTIDIVKALDLIVARALLFMLIEFSAPLSKPSITE